MTDEGRAIARLEAQMAYMIADWEAVKVVLMARSGDLERMDRFDHDLNGLGEKFRGGERRLNHLDQRIDLIEKKRARETGIAVGLLAALQALWTLGGDAIKHFLFGGPR